MKKSILLGSVFILVFMASFPQAQALRRDHQKSAVIAVSQQVHPDGVMMTGGTMKLVKDGVITAMETEITMSNGTSVLVDGTIIKKDKTRMMMQDGQHIDMAGVITEMKD